MARRACRPSEINPRCPGSGGGVPIIFVTKGIVNIAVLGFGKYFDLGMVRAKVALAAGLGFSGFHHGKTMARMTTGATAFAAVHVDPAHPDVGPGGRCQFAVFHFQDGAVAVVTSVDPFKIAVHAFVEPGINFPYDFKRIGVFAFAVLHGLIRMAPGAILGGDDCRNGDHVFFLPVFRVICLVLFKMGLADVRIAWVCGVTIVTGNIGTGMAAGSPVRKYTRMLFFMAFDTGHGLGCHGPFNSELFGFWHIHPGI